MKLLGWAISHYDWSLHKKKQEANCFVMRTCEDEGQERLMFLHLANMVSIQNTVLRGKQSCQHPDSQLSRPQNCETIDSHHQNHPEHGTFTTASLGKQAQAHKIL